MDMTAQIETQNGIEAALPSVAGAVTATNATRLADLWPPAMIGLGLILTLGWNVGLFLLLWRVI
jgi:hypothetical protein